MDEVSRYQVIQAMHLHLLKDELFGEKNDDNASARQAGSLVSASLVATDRSCACNKTEVLRSAAERSHACFHKHIYVTVMVPVNEVDIVSCQIEK